MLLLGGGGVRVLNAVVLVGEDELGRTVRAVLETLPVRIVREDLPDSRLAHGGLPAPEFILVDASVGGEAFERMLAGARLLWPSAVIAAIHPAPDAETLISGLHSGIQDFIVPPIDVQLPMAVKRIAARLADREQGVTPHGGKLIGFTSCKGGCGATTIACHVAVGLQRFASQDVLLIDVDCGEGLVGFYTRANTKYSVVDAARNTHRLDRSYWKAIVSTYSPRLDVLPGPQGPVQKLPDPDHFRNVFRVIGPMYGWIVADLGRGLNPVSRRLLDDLDELFVVCIADPAAIFLAGKLLAQLEELRFPPNRVHLVLNRVAPQSGPLAAQIAERLGIPVDGELPDRPALDDIYADSKPAIHKSPLNKHLAGISSRLFGSRPVGQSA